MMQNERPSRQQTQQQRSSQDQLPSRDDDELLVLTSMRCNYRDLVWLLEHVEFDHHIKHRNANWTANMDGPQKSTKCFSRRLPVELAVRIASFLLVKRVQQSNVYAVSCSSSDQRHDLQSCLSDAEDTWWISAPGSMPRGQGREWVEFSLTDAPAVRLHAFSIKIPPLPQGPLSAHDFRMEGYLVAEEFLSIVGGVTDHRAGNRPFGVDGREGGHQLPLCIPLSAPTWTILTPARHLDNQSGYQRFELPIPVDVKMVRIVCLSNQMSAFLSVDAMDRFGRHFDSVGFFSIKFE